MIWKWQSSAFLINLNSFLYNFSVIYQIFPLFFGDQLCIVCALFDGTNFFFLYFSDIQALESNAPVGTFLECCRNILSVFTIQNHLRMFPECSETVPIRMFTFRRQNLSMLAWIQRHYGAKMAHFIRILTCYLLFMTSSRIYDVITPVLMTS